MTEYTTRRATVDDKNAIYNVLVESYFKDMPLFSACRMSEPPSIDVWPALQELGNGLTVVAVTGSGEIVGVAINVVPKDGGDIVGLPEAIEKFFTKIEEDSKGLLSELEKTTMELRIMAVAREHRGKGISKKLIEETEKIAKSVGRTSVFAIPTGAFMEAAFRRQNWETTYSFLYKDYPKLDPNFIVPPPPHDTLSIVEKKLF